MTYPKQGKPSKEREACAPYNFVPLPEKVIPANSIPHMDAYHTNLHTGWLDCELTNSSPLYIRAGLTPKQFNTEDNSNEDKADFFYTDTTTLEPVIPGSSLRGMFRNLIEIISYSKITPVADKPKITYRAIAAPKDDPLSEPYKALMGNYGSNVKVGYLEKRREKWFIRPAKRPSECNMSEKGHYIKVKDRQIPDNAIPNFRRFSHPEYLVQYHEVYFNTENGKGKRGSYTYISSIGITKDAGKHKGILICTGNMAESGGTSKRKNYALVLEPNTKAKTIEIESIVIQNYQDSLTDFEKSKPFNEKWGCLEEGRPIFYIEENNKIMAFGHCPNFRIPAWPSGNKKGPTASPLDFLPKELRDPDQTDLAEAIFGYVEQEKQATRLVANAGRVFISDATLIQKQENIWLDNNKPVIVPKILASPKPTTFQHYLVQQTSEKVELSHYSSDTPDETVIRGHKLYWHKEKEVIRTEIEEPDQSKWSDTQHTKIKPLRRGVQFTFRIHFENLNDTELGALLWLLDIAADEKYRLKLGMGKSLGLGSVKVESKLHLTDRKARYSQLFDAENWAIGTQAEEPTTEIKKAVIQSFTESILTDSVLNPQKISQLEDVERIRMLLFLLSWPGPDSKKTRYLEIEHEYNGNEYKERYVLPTPADVLNNHPKSGSPQPQQSIPRQVLTVLHESPKPRQPRKSGAETSGDPDQPPQKSGYTKPVKKTISHPSSIEEIEVGDLLEGTVIKVSETRIQIDLGLDASGSIGLKHLDRLVQDDPYFLEIYKSYQHPTALDLFTNEYLEDDLIGTRIVGSVLKIEKRQKTIIKMDFKEWHRNQ